jgi:hypothetical protein
MLNLSHGRERDGDVRRITGLVILGLLITTTGSSQSMSVGIDVTPRYTFPVGQTAEYFVGGLGGEFSALVAPERLSPVSLGGGIGYTQVPLALGQPIFEADVNLSLIDAGVGLRVGLPLGNRFSVAAGARAGGYYALLHGEREGTDFGAHVQASLGAGLLISNQLLVRAGATYSTCMGLFDGLSVMLGLTTRLSGPGSAVVPREDFVPPRPIFRNDGGSVQFKDIELTRVFPVLYKYYDTHPIGVATVVNTGRTVVEDLEIRLVLAQYMDAAKLSIVIDHLEPGEEKQVEIFALFNEEILTITEGARLSTEIKATYSAAGEEHEEIATVTLETWDRNAMTWDDNQKIAAFVTPRDEEIQKVARNVASLVQDDGLVGFAPELQLAMALLELMDVFGCAYIVDPASSYADLSADASAVDSIQFPRQTLYYQGGDCDDLSSAYNALLESVGVESAFVVVPGHIYSAVRIQMTESEARQAFSRDQDLIVLEDGSVWAPVETTALRSGFMNAWALGARQWREFSEEGEAELIPVRQAWVEYEPVAFSVSSYALDPPDRTQVALLFKTELDEFIDGEIGARERVLLTRIEGDPGDTRSRTALGVLYARYGRLEEAKEHFERARPRASAYMNLGNIAYLDGDLASAKMNYERALGQDPEYPAAILGLTRIAHDREDFETAHASYEQLAEVSPELAERFSYLGSETQSVGRAAATALLGQSVVWDEQ